jgi:uncharacterized SAM-binding protein YcdF (DUF218 family)
VAASNAKSTSNRATKSWRRRKGKTQKIMLSLIGILFIWLTFLGVEIYAYSADTDLSPADAAIVLGAGVINNQPSPVLRERINQAIHLYQSGVVSFLIFTGGIGEGDRLTESEVARKYAIEQGIPEDRIFIETSSHITYENLVEAQKIVAEMGFDRVLIVSDPLHMKRAMTMAEDLGLNAFPSPTPTSAYISFQRRSRFLVREIFFYAGYLLSHHVLYIR